MEILGVIASMLGRGKSRQNSGNDSGYSGEDFVRTFQGFTQDELDDASRAVSRGRKITINSDDCLSFETNSRRGKKDRTFTIRADKDGNLHSNLGYYENEYRNPADELIDELNRRRKK